MNWHSSSPSSWPTVGQEIIKTSFCPVTNWSCSLGSIWKLSWIFIFFFIFILQGYLSFIKLQLQSTRWVCGGESFKEQFFLLFRAILCMCVCVGYWLLTPVCFSPSQPAVPKHPLSALQNATFWGTKMKRCSLILKNLKVLTVKYRFQIIKHAICARFYFNYSKIHVT